MVKTKWLKHPYLWFQSVFNSSVCNCCGGACVLSGKRTNLHNKYFGYCVIHYHISSAPQAFCFLKCSLLARKICQMLVLAKIKTLLACSQMLAKTILYPSFHLGSSRHMPRSSGWAKGRHSRSAETRWNALSVKRYRQISAESFCYKGARCNGTGFHYSIGNCIRISNDQWCEDCVTCGYLFYC